MKKKDYVVAAILSIIVCVIAGVLVTRGVNIDVKVDGAPQVNATAPTQAQTQAPTVAPTEAPTQAPAETPSQNGDVAPEATEPSKNEDGGIPQGNEAILAKYSEIVNAANEQKVGYNKVEFQAIPEEKANLGGILDKIMPVASTFFVDEATAKQNPETFQKGGDMAWFPLYHTTKGCVLTDVSKIENATSEKLADGNIKLTIELQDEMNPEPIADGATTCNSYTGSMFTPIKRADVDDVLQNNFAVKMLIKDLNYDLKYHDCTAELIYNPETNQIVSLTQYMHILIIVNSGKVAGSDVTGDAILDNSMFLTEFVY